MADNNNNQNNNKPDRLSKGYLETKIGSLDVTMGITIHESTRQQIRELKADYIFIYETKYGKYEPDHGKD